MTSGERLRRADRLPRRRRRWRGWPAIADLFLVHDRPIHMRTDDSVVRASSAAGAADAAALARLRAGQLAAAGAGARPDAGAAAPSSRARSASPRGARAWVGHHIGDLEQLRDAASPSPRAIAHFERLFAVAPEVVAHDLHPDYLSTALRARARGRASTSASSTTTPTWPRASAEHGETGPGGRGDLRRHRLRHRRHGVGRRAAGRRPARLRARRPPARRSRLPGGDARSREPWRMACAWLVEAFGRARRRCRAALAGEVDRRAWRAVAALAASGFSAPVTTSAGRLFDAVAALCGLRARVNYEGQAAIELEAACDPAERGAYEIPVDADARARPAAGDPRRRAPTSTRGASAGAIAARFHHGLADATAARLRASPPRGHGPGPRRPVGRRLPEPRSCSSARPRCCERAGLRVLAPDRAAAGRRRRSPTARPPSRQLAHRTSRTTWHSA